MPRNKKIKNDYYKKINLLARYDLYFKNNNNKLPVSEDEYQDLKDEILILETRYPSIKKLSKSFRVYKSTKEIKLRLQSLKVNA